MGKAVARMREMRTVYNMLTESITQTNHSQDSGRIILKLTKSYFGVWNGFIWLRIWTNVRFLRVY